MRWLGGIGWDSGQIAIPLPRLQSSQFLQYFLHPLPIAHHFEERLGLLQMHAGMGRLPLLVVEQPQVIVESCRVVLVADALHDFQCLFEMRKCLPHISYPLIHNG